MTQKWYATLCHPKMHPHTKFGIPTSKNIGDMDRTRKRDGHTDGLTDGRTVRLLYASQSSFGGIKTLKKYGFTVTDAEQEADLLNNHFYSVFSQQIPMKLSAFCSLQIFHKLLPKPRNTRTPGTRKGRSETPTCSQHL